MAVLVHTRLCGSTILLRLYHWRTSDLNATGRCRPTIRSRSSLRSKLQRVDMAAALGNGSPTAIPATFKWRAWAAVKQPVKGRPKLTCASTRVRRYPTEQQIMAVRPDFIVGAYGSAFAEERYTGATSYSRRGIFSDATVGPCDGENSDFFPAGTQHGQIAPLAVTEPGLCSSSWPLVALNGSAAGVLSGTLGHLPTASSSEPTYCLKCSSSPPFYSKQAMRRT